MTPLSVIAIERSKRLSVGHELELHRAASARSPQSQLIRSRLAKLMAQSDQHEGVIDLLREATDLSHIEYSLLIQSYLAQRTPEADRQACNVAEAALANASTNQELAAVLAVLGKALTRLNDDRAPATFEQALAFDPSNNDACKRLAAWLLDRGEPQAVLDFTEKTAALGAAHPWNFAAQVLALARLGRFEDARELDGRQQLGTVCRLPAPIGWDSIDAFNAALAAQLLAHPGLQYERDGTASEKTWRIDSLVTPDAPLAEDLLDLIRFQVGQHVAALEGLDHRWLGSLPQAGTLSGSCLITEGDGHETWHMHEFGSLSGVYYVAVPEAMESAAANGGCLAFGLPPEVVGDPAAAGFGIDVIRPASGDLWLFPSHSFHCTYPHRSSGHRICVAFDIWPN